MGHFNQKWLLYKPRFLYANTTDHTMHNLKFYTLVRHSREVIKLSNTNCVVSGNRIQTSRSIKLIKVY